MATLLLKITLAIVFIAGSIASIAALAIVGYAKFGDAWFADSGNRQVYTRSEFRRRFSRATVEEVRHVLGDPDAVGDNVAAVGPGLGPPIGDALWIYHNRVRKDNSSYPDKEVFLRFSRGRVCDVIFNDIIIFGPNPVSGGGGGL